MINEYIKIVVLLIFFFVLLGVRYVILKKRNNGKNGPIKNIGFNVAFVPACGDRGDASPFWHVVGIKKDRVILRQEGFSDQEVFLCCFKNPDGVVIGDITVVSQYFSKSFPFLRWGFKDHPDKKNKKK